MCCCNEEKKGCQKPENLKGKLEDCSPEQIKKCHGDVKAHSCLPKKDAREGGAR